MKMHKMYVRVLSIVVASLIMLPANVVTIFAQEMSSITITDQRKAKYFIPGYRILLSAYVNRPTHVKSMRCYFRTSQTDNYVYVNMFFEPSIYNFILPAPSEYAKKIEYLFVAEDKKGNSFKTKPYFIERDISAGQPVWQQIDPEGDIYVTNESGTGYPRNFSDSIILKKGTPPYLEDAGLIRSGLYQTTKSQRKEVRKQWQQKQVANRQQRKTVKTTVKQSDSGSSKVEDEGGSGWLWGILGGIGGVALIAIAAGGGSGGDDSPTIEKPTVTATDPVAGSEISSYLDNIIIEFSKKMDQEAVTVNSVKVEHDVIMTDVNKFSQWYSSNISWSNGGKTLNIYRVNSLPLAPGTQIKFTTLDDFKDSEGNMMDQYSFSVTVNPGLIIDWDPK